MVVAVNDIVIVSIIVIVVIGFVFVFRVYATRVRLRGVALLRDRHRQGNKETERHKQTQSNVAL